MTRVRAAVLAVVGLASLACSGLPADGDVAAPELVEAAPAGEAGCLGTWTGELKDNRSNFTGTITLTLTEPTEPSIDDPEGGRCGELVEKWGDGGRCEQVFNTCTVGRKAVGVGWPKPVMDCDKSNFELDCSTGEFQRLERSDGYRVMGTLEKSG